MESHGRAGATLESFTRVGATFGKATRASATLGRTTRATTTLEGFCCASGSISTATRARLEARGASSCQESSKEPVTASESCEDLQ